MQVNFPEHSLRFLWVNVASILSLVHFVCFVQVPQRHRLLVVDWHIIERALSSSIGCYVFVVHGGVGFLALAEGIDVANETDRRTSFCRREERRKVIVEAFPHTKPAYLHPSRPSKEG